MFDINGSRQLKHTETVKPTVNIVRRPAVSFDQGRLFGQPRSSVVRLVTTGVSGGSRSVRAAKVNKR